MDFLALIGLYIFVCWTKQRTQPHLDYQGDVCTRVPQDVLEQLGSPWDRM